MLKQNIWNLENYLKELVEGVIALQGHLTSPLLLSFDSIIKEGALSKSPIDRA
jgi:hypothetical protein